MKRFGSKNSLNPSEEGGRSGSRERKEAMIHIEATGKCVREYGSVTG
jgi:hypothetical protein